MTTDGGAFDGIFTSIVENILKVIQGNESAIRHAVVCLVAGGHLLIVPYKQSPDLNGLTDGELSDLFLLTRRCQNALTELMHPDGFNIGLNLGHVAGAGIVDHVHVHVVPRWSGDTNFMPVIAQTTVLPEALAEVAARLRAALAS